MFSRSAFAVARASLGLQTRMRRRSFALLDALTSTSVDFRPRATTLSAHAQANHEP